MIFDVTIKDPRWSLTFSVLLMIKLTTVITLLMITQAAGKSLAQSINLKATDITLAEAMRRIQHQSGYTFFLSGEHIGELKVNPEIEDANLKQAMDDLLTPLGLEWVSKGDIIIVKPPARRAMPTKRASLALHETPRPQQRMINGRVTDESGAALEGVTVAVKGSSLATSTDPDGRYQLTLPENAQVLVFSIVGYGQQEQSIGEQSVINMTLRESMSDLEEVVVVGYGTQRKSDVTGAVSTLEGRDIAERQAVQVSQALQGAVAGVTVTRDNGAPGASSTVRVRGVTTIGNNDALVIVDGVPTSNINNVNPNDIASISVLKDGASASIYGSRAAAGVILITTKRAREGQSALNYQYEFGLESPTQLPEYTDIVRYMELFNEYLHNDGTAPLYPADLINNYWENHRANPDAYPATDWQSAILRNNAPRHRHDLSFIAGTAKLKTNASLSYAAVDGLYENRSYDRYTARINNDIQVNDFIKANVDVFYKRTFSEAIAGENPIYAARALPGHFAHLYSDGRYAPGKEGRNPYAEVRDGGFRNETYNQLGGRLMFEAKPLKGLTMTALVSPTFDFNKVKVFSRVIEYSALENPGQVIYRNRPNTILREERPETFTFNGQMLVNYATEIAMDHRVEALLGYEENYIKSEELMASRQGFALQDFPYLDVGALDLRDNSGTASEAALRSVFGRLMYNYKDRYLLQGNLRMDGSSRFHRDHRWGLFPSFSAGWVISEEPFFNGISHAVPHLKFRGSWGILGNERMVNFYPYQASISFNNVLFYQNNALLPLQTGAQLVYAMSNITWETTESLDLGMDVTFLNSRLTATVDYYQKETRDILLQLDIPSYIGYGAPNQNAGVVRARGWDLELGWRDNIGELNYTVSANVSDVKTQVVDLKGTQLRGNMAQIEGHEFNSWFGYVSEGLFQTEAELQGAPVPNANTRVGDVRYVDINGDGRITPEGDMVPLRGAMPRYTYGGNIRLDYKGFDLGVVFQGVGRVNSRLSNVQVEPFLEAFGNIPTNIDGNFWSPYNTPEQNLAAKYPRLSRTSASNNYQMSDFWLINGAYFRLKNVTLGYSLPTETAAKIRMQGLRIYVAANDAVTLHGFPRGWDPEVGSGSYPIVRTVMVGLGLTL
ncbi:SusC/RagA family TonB-linked outer membrane protein [Parapedobacter deserti]|uniref:SusC/RagA family TonB-linked outer membrane protein n=1 Tax=Parapedobacter deserti TaxID=1912957 RepID=A0ABV7JPL8_9SPHI